VIIEQAILNRLISNTTLVSDSNIYYIKAKQDVVPPYIILTRISAPRDYAYSGAALVDSRFQISIFATTYTSCKAIGVEVMTAFSGFSGLMGGAGGVYVGKCFCDDETDLPFDDDTKLYGLALDFIFSHSE
jgi:hypothetical protein